MHNKEPYTCVYTHMCARIYASMCAYWHTRIRKIRLYNTCMRSSDISELHCSLGSVFDCYNKAFPGTLLYSSENPRWCFLFPIFDSSICTTFPGPPSLSLFSKIVTSHNSRQNMSQSTAVCDPRPSCCLICHWSSPWHHQYVNFITSSIEKLDFSNRLPSLMLFSTRCLFFPFCLRHCHTKPSEWSLHSTQFMLDWQTSHTRLDAMSPPSFNQCSVWSLLHKYFSLS